MAQRHPAPEPLSVFQLVAWNVYRRSLRHSQRKDAEKLRKHLEGR